MKPTPLPTPASSDLQLWLWFGSMLALSLVALYFSLKIERAFRRARTAEEAKLLARATDEESSKRKAA